MLIRIFFTVLRSIAIPIAAYLALKNSFLGESGAFLAISIAVTVINIVSILFGVVKILPNVLLLRGMKVVGMILSILIEVASIAGFWLYYFIMFN